MAAPLTIALPPNLALAGGATIRVTAYDPTTGAIMPNVQISNVTLQVDQTQGDVNDLVFGPFLLVDAPPV